MHALHPAKQSPPLLFDGGVHKASLKPAADAAVEGLWQSQNFGGMAAVQEPAQYNLLLADLQVGSVMVDSTPHGTDNNRKQLQHSAAHLQHS